MANDKPTRRGFFRRATAAVLTLAGLGNAPAAVRGTSRNATFIRFDDDTVSPVLNIRWGEFKTVILKGDWLREKLASTPDEGKSNGQ